MEKYKTPKLDAILLNAGWYRPNEAILYVKKTTHEDYKEAYRYCVASAGDWFYSMEDWPLEQYGSEKLNEVFTCNCDHNYVAGNIIEESILQLTADFWHWERNFEMRDKYASIYEAFTGNKYEHPGFYKRAEL